MNLRSILLWVLRISALVLLLAYVGDLLVFNVRRHLSNGKSAVGSVHRARLLAIPGKGGKTEYELDSVTPEEDVPCSRSIFPQGGMKPCWYVAKHASDPIPI